MKINEKIIYDHELIRWMNPNRGIVQSYLIGQISKADGESKEIGKMMMDMAMRIFSEGENNFGCRTVRLDCKKPLIGYYEGHGFRYIGKNEDGTLNQMAYTFE